MSVRRSVLCMLAVGAGLLAAPAVAPGQGPRPVPTEAAVQADQRTIIAPTAQDTPTPTPTASPISTPTPPSGVRPQPTVSTAEPTGNNAASQPRAAKRYEAKYRCLENPSRMLATGGSQPVEDRRSWAWLPFLIAAVCAALVASAYAVRRHRAPRGEGASAPPSLLEVVATIVAICAGVAGLVAQFVPGVGAREKTSPEATMTVRAVNARITRAEFAESIRIKPPGDRLDQREVGNVIWLQLHLKGYRGKPLVLQWGSHEVKPGGSLVAATTYNTRFRVSADSDEQTRIQPVWVGYPNLEKFRVQFRLLDHGEVRELASTEGMSGRLARYACP
jgi:hypothetical protein